MQARIWREGEVGVMLEEEGEGYREGTVTPAKGGINWRERGESGSRIVGG